MSIFPKRSEFYGFQEVCNNPSNFLHWSTYGSPKRKCVKIAFCLSPRKSPGLGRVLLVGNK